MSDIDVLGESAAFAAASEVVLAVWAQIVDIPIFIEIEGLSFLTRAGTHVLHSTGRRTVGVRVVSKPISGRSIRCSRGV